MPKKKDVREGATLTDKRANERDVLMGRGKRVSEWPGNIYFRQIVNQHRDAYTEAPRNKKVNIAEKVVEMIDTVGGKFVVENADGTTWHVDRTRAVEKTCQALREKEKANPPTGNPFLDGDEVPSPNKSTAPKSSIPIKKRKKAEPAEVKPVEAADANGASDAETKQPAKKKAKKIKNSKSKADEKPSPPPKKRSLYDDQDMLQKLEKYQQAHGHCAVPPILKKPSEQKFADWCAMQRLFRRACLQQCRIPSPEERATLNALEALDFVWDYEAWSWEQYYHQALHLCDNSQELVAPSPELQTWLSDQRKLYRLGYPLSAERRDKLDRLGLLL